MKPASWIVNLSLCVHGQIFSYTPQSHLSAILHWLPRDLWASASWSSDSIVWHTLLASYIHMAFSWLGFTFICEMEIIDPLYGYRTILGLLPCRKVHHKRVWEEFTVWWKLSQRHVGWVGSKPPHLSCVYKVRIFKIYFNSIGSYPYSKMSVIPLPLSWLMERYREPGLVTTVIWESQFCL